MYILNILKNHLVGKTLQKVTRRDGEEFTLEDDLIIVDVTEESAPNDFIYYHLLCRNETTERIIPVDERFDIVLKEDL